jgi:predicted transcriptional regulator
MAKEFELESPTPFLDGEDEETLAAIDEGIRDAKAGPTVPPKKSESGCLSLNSKFLN